MFNLFRRSSAADSTPAPQPVEPPREPLEVRGNAALERVKGLITEEFIDAIRVSDKQRAGTQLQKRSLEAPLASVTQQLEVTTGETLNAKLSQLGLTPQQAQSIAQYVAMHADQLIRNESSLGKAQPTSRQSDPVRAFMHTLPPEGTAHVRELVNTVVDGVMDRRTPSQRDHVILVDGSEILKLLARDPQTNFQDLVERFHR